METARGRWFLDEYARRNRNADTRMVLDAVARIEETLAAQKQPPPPVVVDRLPAALISIRSAVEKAAGRGVHRVRSDCGSRKTSHRFARAPASSRRSPGAGARSAPTAGSATSSIRRSSPSRPLAASSPRPIRAWRCAPPSRSSGERSRPSGMPMPALQRRQAAVPRATTAGAADAVVAFPSQLASAVHGIAEAPAMMDEPAAVAEIEAAISEPDMPVETATEAVAAELSQEEADAQDEAVLDIIAMEMAAPDPEEEPTISATPSPRASRRMSRRRPSSSRSRSSRERRSRSCAARSTPTSARAAAGASGPRHPSRRNPRRALARLDPDRERHPAKAECARQRSARADPPHEPGREDRVLLVNRSNLAHVIVRDCRHVHSPKPRPSVPATGLTSRFLLRKTPCPLSFRPASNRCCLARACLPPAC